LEGAEDHPALPRGIFLPFCQKKKKKKKKMGLNSPIVLFD
jgi:hypothetical protein